MLSEIQRKTFAEMLKAFLPDGWNVTVEGREIIVTDAEGKWSVAVEMEEIGLIDLIRRVIETIHADLKNANVYQRIAKMKKRMKDLSEEELAQGHKKMWTWLSENPTKRKEDWPDWEEIEPNQTHCFACESMNREIEPNNTCSNCPVVWEGYGCLERNSPYAKWALNLGNKSELALKIANSWKGKRNERVA
jgi:hypothetical protein